MKVKKTVRNRENSVNPFPNKPGFYVSAVQVF